MNIETPTLTGTYQDLQLNLAKQSVSEVIKTYLIT